MQKLIRNKFFVVSVALFTLTAIAASQLKELLKVGGAVAVVRVFGKDINNGINKLWNRKDDRDVKTKVVVIVTAGKGTAIGAAQVMGPPEQVDQVVVVAQPETSLMGIRLRALIPVSDKNTTSIRAVKGVAVSGIVDMKL